MPVRPGSRASLIMETIRRWSDAHGYGPTVEEAKRAFAEEGHDVPTSFTSEVNSLRRRGLLKTEGRLGSLRYTPEEWRPAVAQRPPRQDTDVILDALLIAVEEAGVLVPTNAITRMIARQGWKLESTDQNAVRTRLLNLARTERSKRGGKSNQPSVRLVTVPGADGVRRSYWGPVDRPELKLPENPAASRNEAVRKVLSDAQATLVRPPSTSEVAVWVKGIQGGSEVCAWLLPSDGRPRVRTALRDAARNAGPGGVEVIATPYVAHGGAPLRFWCHGGGDAPSAGGVGAAYLDDFLYVFRIAEETRGLSSLKQILSSQDATTLAPLLAAREEALGSLLDSIEESLPCSVAEAVQVGTVADRTLLQRLGRARTAQNDGYKQRKEIRRRMAARRAFGGRGRETPPTACAGGLPLPVLVGDAYAVPLFTLAPLIEAYVDLEGEPRHLTNLTEGCRRFPNPMLDGWGRIEQSQSTDSRPMRIHDAISLVDRPEAIRQLGNVQSDGWTRVLLRRAYSLLGEIARDPEPLRICLRQEMEDPRLAPAVRRWLVVSAGMLALPDVGPAAQQMLDAAVHQSDTTDLRASLLALALFDPESLSSRVEALLTTKPSRPAEEHLRKVRRRIRHGLWLSLGAA